MKGNRFLNDPNKHTPWFPTPKAYVHMGLTISPFRYVDNIMGVWHGPTSLATVQKFFQKLLGVQLKVEGEGHTWTSLNATLTFSQHTGLISVAMKNCLLTTEPVHKRVVRYPDVHSPNAPKVLESLTPLLVLDSCFYATSVPEANANLSQVLREFHRKGYPTHWWKKHALRVLNTLGRRHPLPTWATYMGSELSQALCRNIQSW